MNPRRMAVEMWPTLVFGGGLVVLVGCIGTAREASAVRVVDRLAPSLAANAKAVVALPQVPQTVAEATPAINIAEVAAAAEMLAEVTAREKPQTDKTQAVVVATLSNPAQVLPQEASVQPVDATVRENREAEKPQTVVVATLSDPAEVMPLETGVQAAAAAAASVADPPPEAAAVPGRVEIIGECLVAEACIDQYLWELYERTPKQDTTREYDRHKVKVRKKGKLITVTRTTMRLVNNDFTWKDPKAAERIGMSMIDYVIGGMEKGFKMKLFYMLQAAENAGLAPGITSAFRDDYRQSIASGLKAASDRSYHGGSSRGGYGHGLAADIVSTRGATKSQRWVSTEALWKWVDTNGKDFGIGRPYLDHDPPHVGPIDGKEYVSKRGAPKAADSDAKPKAAGSDGKKSDGKAAQDKPGAAKRPVAAKSSKGRST